MKQNPRRVSFSNGLGWLPAAAALMFSRPGPLAGIAALWLLVSMVAMIIPLLGQILLVLFTPLLTAGVLAGFDQIRRGQAPSPLTLFAGWQDPARRSGLILIGAWSMLGSMLAAAILVGWLSSQMSPEELEAAFSSPETLAQSLSGVSFGGGLLLSVLVISLVLAAIYFAIPLVMFDRLPALGALLLSLRAVLINWMAFLGFLLAFVLVAMALGLILALLLSFFSLALGQAGMFVGQVLFLISTMLIQVLMAGTQYVAFGQIFTLPGPDTKPDEPDDQLFA